MAAALALLVLAMPIRAADGGGSSPITRSGREIYANFRAGLADPSCAGDGGSARWRQHFATAPKQLAGGDDELLPLFGYVVDAVRAAQLPTEYALIPFVESGYRPGARSPGGPAGLWQMIAVTARNHNVPMRAGYDGRLSPIDSTQAALRYLKTLHGMFAGDWRLAVMAYNAGEYRVLGALRRSGQVARSADPETLVGLPDITRAYVRKLRALSCLLDQADEREDWLQTLDRPVAVLSATLLPAQATSLDRWATDNGLDPARVRRLNPAFADGRIARAQRALRVLAPMPTPMPTPRAMGAVIATPAAAMVTAATGRNDAVDPPRTHTVARGESAWRIARRYRLRLADLLARNGLDARSPLTPGMVLQLDRAQSRSAPVD